MSRQHDEVVGVLEDILEELEDLNAHLEGVNPGVDADKPTCGYNGCSRTVENPEDRCWQHSDS